MAAQFTLMNGRAPLALHWCIARATSSFPVPVSPVIRTVLRVADTSSMRRIRSATGRLSPTIPYDSTRRPAIDESTVRSLSLASFTTPPQHIVDCRLLIAD
jgi:hypothetical protein